MRPSPQRLLVFGLLLAFLIAFIQVGLVSIAFAKLGLSEESAYLLLMATLFGSLFNLPLFVLKADPAAPPPPEPPAEIARILKLPPWDGQIRVMVNAGGALVPLAFCVHLMLNTPLEPFKVLGATLAVALVAKHFSWIVPGLGIAMPMLLAPLAAALIAWLLETESRAALAYISGSLGVLIGADLLRLNDIRRLGARFAAIGGGGTLDGIFLTGILAVLLA